MPIELERRNGSPCDGLTRNGFFITPNPAPRRYESRRSGKNAYSSAQFESARFQK
jgi:hypothetical protein